MIYPLEMLDFGQQRAIYPLCYRDSVINFNILPTRLRMRLGTVR